jgi:hypothetical protein
MLQAEASVATPSERVAGFISSVVQSTALVYLPWDALPDHEKERIRRRGAALIDTDPRRAADHIVQDIAAHPALGSAWQQLGPRGRDSRKAIVADRKAICADLIARYGPEAQAHSGSPAGALRSQ